MQKVVTPVKTGVQENRNCLKVLDSDFLRDRQDSPALMKGWCAGYQSLPMSSAV
jgi:hypothetical protein